MPSVHLGGSSKGKIPVAPVSAFSFCISMRRVEGRKGGSTLLIVLLVFIEKKLRME